MASIGTLPFFACGVRVIDLRRIGAFSARGSRSPVYRMWSSITTTVGRPIAARLGAANGRSSAATWTETQPITLKRRDRFGGLLPEFERAA
jgi:hypothetical protein